MKAHATRHIALRQDKDNTETRQRERPKLQGHALRQHKTKTTQRKDTDTTKTKQGKATCDNDKIRTRQGKTRQLTTFKSAPLQKNGPVPVKTTRATSSSSSAFMKASGCTKKG